MAGDAKFIITRFIPAKGLLNTLGYSTEMLDEASIDASRINQPPSSSSRPIPCSEGVQIYMECTVRTIQVDKAHLWSHSSKKHQSFPQQTLSSSADGHLYQDWCTNNQSSSHLSQCWEQGQVFPELLHIVAPVRPVAQCRESASWGSSSGECTNTINR